MTASTHFGRETIHVLHVDDDPDFAELAATFLVRAEDRLDVTTVQTASDGLEQLATGDFDCIISDYDMPGQNGVEFLEAVREDYPEIPFILYTGKGSEEIASEAISAGVSDYLQKEGGTDQYTVLANRVMNLVSQHRAETNLEEWIEQQEVVAELGRQALAGGDLDELFEAATAAVADALDNEYAKVLEYVPESSELFLRAGVGWQDGLVGEATVSDSLGSQAGYTLQSEEPVIVDDLPSEQRFQGPPLLTEHDVRSGISVIIGDVEDPWGVLGTHTTARKPFSEHDVTFVQTVANVLATAIERTQHEMELARNKRAMDEAPVGITITDPSQDDNPIIYANQSFQNLTGYDESEILGRNCRFLQGEETDNEKVAAMREAIDAEERVSVELRNYRNDGSEFWNRVSIAPVRNEEGVVKNYVGFQEDVTEKRRRQERFHRQRETLLELASDDAVTSGEFDEAVRRITETAAGVLDVPRVNVWLLDDDGETFTCADQYERGADAHSRGQELAIGEYPVYLDALESSQAIAVEDVDADTRISELSEYVSRNNIGALLDGTLRSEGEVIGVICHEHQGGPREWIDDEIEFASDVADIVHRALRNQQQTEREQQLQQQNERLDAFTRIVSHDLRNPLQIADGHLQIAREEQDSEHLEQVAQAHDRMNRLIEDLLTLAHEGTQAIDGTDVDLAACCEAAWQNVETAGATLVTNTDQTLHADRGQLQQLLENLYRNAIEHGGSDVTVTIGELSDGFYIEDNGPGIPAEERSEIVTAGYSTSEDGTGFGLSIVQQIVDTHDWTLTITESTTGGARFEITGTN
ncbi:GAF domain-containing protein [Halobacterium sp. KA-6]|uniref:GAF domain-containing protein n=1 Tax=Halobacterium sp. KA-6 TaxID=2896368 RepID=UPI001E3B24AE|nr:GAF domain-containing protein [Halobacterium sp. KA-6]MCD2205068.1 GAF domain-containing protein [Halobacterium sp. KA-6]